MVNKRSPFNIRHAQRVLRGYTLVELITVMVVVGVLAAVALPKFFNNSTFQSRGFADQVQGTLRYAQKVAIAQHHNVCVALSSSGITLTVNSISTSACPGDTNLASPTGKDSILLYAQTPCTSSSVTYQICSPSTSIALVNSPSVTSFFFDPLGKPFDAVGTASTQRTFTISGSTNTVIVEAETGYVHSP